jgi:catechol 2,3-dioxygenase
VVSEAIYLDDPDGNGIELCVDRPPESWPRYAQGKLKMGGRALDMNDLLAELERVP